MDIIRGDWRFFWPENISYFIGMPSAWDASLNSGLGQSSIPLLWINSYLNLSASFTSLGLPWWSIGYIFWLFPAVITSFLSMYFLFKFFFPKQKMAAIFAGVIYVCNTYFLSLISGGQFGVALSYAIAPFVLLSFALLFKKQTVRTSITSGLVLSLQILFDPRLTYITIIALATLFCFQFSRPKHILKFLLYTFFVPGLLVVLLHSFWLLPSLLFRGNTVATQLGVLESFRFFSFADFSHAFSFLHPNWPENIFGKVYFLQPQFLLIPLAAFSSLLFVKRENKKTILPFLYMAFLGVFLAKGVNVPFGNINEFIYLHVPGMGLFRDPTKFYLLIALSYSLVIPFAISSIEKKYKKKFVLSWALAVWFVILFSSFTLGNPLLHFLPKQAPNDYVKLKDFLLADNSFYRTLWVPKLQRYRYFSDENPSAELSEVTNKKTDAIEKIFNDTSFEEKLKHSGIRYVIVPYDSESEIFLNDRKYDEKLYKSTVKKLDTISWLKKKKQFGKIVVYEIDNAKQRFWFVRSNTAIQSKAVSGTNYTVSFSGTKVNDRLVFNDRFDPYWVVKSNNETIHSEKYENSFNSFVLKKGQNNLKVYYEPQLWVERGFIISGLTLFISLFLLIRYRKK
jgi:hypothetical protein